MYLRIDSHPLLQIHLQNRLKCPFKVPNFCVGCHSANKFAVTGANEFANTFNQTNSF